MLLYFKNQSKYFETSNSSLTSLAVDILRFARILKRTRYPSSTTRATVWSVRMRFTYSRPFVDRLIPLMDTLKWTRRQLIVLQWIQSL